MSLRGSISWPDTNPPQNNLSACHFQESESVRKGSADLWPLEAVKIWRLLVGQKEFHCLTSDQNHTLNGHLTATPCYLCATRHLLKSSSSCSHTFFHKPTLLSSILGPIPFWKKTDRHHILIIWAFGSRLTVCNHIPCPFPTAAGSLRATEWMESTHRTRGSHYSSH